MHLGLALGMPVNAKYYDSDATYAICNTVSLYVGNACTQRINLLLRFGADIDIANGYPIRLAALRNMTDVVEYLVTCGAEVNTSKGTILYVTSPIEWAQQNGNAEMIRILRDAGSRPPKLN